MTKKELLAAIESYSDDAEVLVIAYEGEGEYKDALFVMPIDYIDEGPLNDNTFSIGMYLTPDDANRVNQD